MRIFITALLLLIIAASVSPAQTPQQPDSTRVVAAADSSAVREVSLEDIHIEAVIEKPAVTLIPKRITPEMGEAPAMVRSFDRELKQRPRFISEMGREPDAGERMQTAKKILRKKRK